MESQRSLLVIAFFAVTFMLWQQWQFDHAPKVTPPTSNTSQSTASGNDDIPQASEHSATNINTQASTTQIKVTTDVFEIQIDPRGGDIIEADLIKYEQTLGSKTPFRLLQPTPHKYIAQSGLTGTDGIDRIVKGRPLYASAKQSYTMKDDTLVVDLTYQHESGVNITKRYTFTSGSYAVKLAYIVDNQSTKNINVQLYTQLKQSTLKDTSSGMMPTSAYWGTAYSTSEEKYEKYDFSDIEDANLNKQTQGGWVAMIQHYFVSAWVPEKSQTNLLYSNYNNQKEAIIGVKAPAVNIAPQQQANLTATLYVGPKNQDSMAKIADGLELTVDYGMLFFISQPLFWLLVKIQSFVHNWGIAIIVITLIVKGGMYWLTKKQYTSMAKMRELQPKLASLKDRFGDDRQKMSQAMMELYRKEKVNPAGGCLPILIQMPIFIALYWVFLESVELRHADFGLWIHDLSAKDPYFILPIIYGITMFIMQKMQPVTIQDPMQQKMMQYMPVLFTFFFFMFPSGLVLYWVVSNIISIIQMKIIFAGIEKKKQQ